ncbi:hypothetical protein [Paenibacillus koleovorans]|uniref:hypothetical protein n=1 Tax=Paenibacillus koleovorans TaxID=121608 RepID=UPI000FDC355F|nr:hypothetical protein [Paenibacillus koleovorans]
MNMKLLLFLLLGLVSASIGCAKSEMSNSTKINNTLATPGNPVVSKSGKYQLIVEESKEDGVAKQSFIIKNISNETIYSSIEKFRIRDTLYFLWDEEDRVWVYSGDVGTYIWTQINERSWNKQSFSEMKGVLNPPEQLKKLKPHYFN